jgi:hypothetical protein
MALVSAHLDFGVDENLRQSWRTESVQGAVSPIRTVGPCIMLESLKDASRVLGSPNPSYKQQPPPLRERVLLKLFCQDSFVIHRFVRPQLVKLIIHL